MFLFYSTKCVREHWTSQVDNIPRFVFYNLVLQIGLSDPVWVIVDIDNFDNNEQNTSSQLDKKQE